MNLSVSILALSGAPRPCRCGSQRLLRCRSHPAGRNPALSAKQTERFFPHKKEADSHLPLFPCTYRFAFAVFFRMMSHEASGCAGCPTPSSGRSSGCADLRKPHRGTASQPQHASRGRRRRDGPAGSYRAPGPWRPSSGGRAYRHGSSRCSPCRPRGCGRLSASRRPPTRRRGPGHAAPSSPWRGRRCRRSRDSRPAG